MTDTRRFPCEPRSVTAARDFVRASLRGRPQELVEAAELMASELATNCVRHARTDFELAVFSGNDVRVEVRDTGGGTPRPRSPEPRDPSGRGLRIVEAMSDAWGVIGGAEGKIVWFTLSADGAGAEPAGGAAEARPAADRRGGGLVRALACARVRVSLCAAPRARAAVAAGV
jgi:anti-sigma regulatory factor (Ser/Thr protein kinase)